jgi:ClpP class serine protease
MTHKNTVTIGVIAQNHARKVLLEKYRDEYNAIYRAEMIRLGGRPRPTKEEKIQMLKEQIEKLEAEK